MTRKRREHRQSNAAAAKTAKTPGRRALDWLSRWWLAVALVLGGAGLMWWATGAGEPSVAMPAAESAAASAEGSWDPNWPPLPAVGAAPPRPMEEVRAAYALAARRGDLLQYVPCYCGCEKVGHSSNRDCYVRGQAADGTPVWDDHALT